MGNELNSTVVTSPENAQKQAEMDRQNFGQNYAESETMPTQTAVLERQSALATADRIFKERQFEEMQKKQAEKEAGTAKIIIPEKTAATGQTKPVFTERGTKTDVTTKVISANDLLTSLDKGYPAELQPRDRSRVASKAQISNIASNLNPAFLDDSPKASDGRPLVVPVQLGDKIKYAVISGNGRSEAIREAYRSGNEGAQNYAEFARSKDQTTDFENPVYVGILNPNQIPDLAEFAKEANEQSTAAMSSSEQAKTDAERMNPELLASFMPSDDGTIHAGANRDFIRGFMSQVVGRAEQGKLITSNGKLSQEGINRIKNAILSKTYGETEEGQSLVTKISESTDNNVKRITNALLQNAGKFAALKQAVKDGTRFSNLDITNDLAKATAKYSALKSEGMTVEEHLSQPNMFGEELSPFQKFVLSTIDNYSFSAKALNGILSNYSIAADALGDPNQAALFGGDETPDTPSLFKAAIEEYEEGYYEQPKQKGFDFSQKTEVQPEARAAGKNSDPQKGQTGESETETRYEQSGRLPEKPPVLVQAKEKTQVKNVSSTLKSKLESW